MKILAQNQIKAADQYTIKNEPIASIDLMERASLAFVNQLVHLYSCVNKRIKIFCGTGNNGGDGLAIGRLLQQKGWEVHIYVCGNLNKSSPDFKINFERLKNSNIEIVNEKASFPKITKDDLVIDALFGTGISQPIVGFLASLIQTLNQSKAQIIAVDIASGLHCDNPPHQNEVIIKPHLTISFETPKLTFFYPSCYEYVGKWLVVSIQLSKFYLQNVETNFATLDPKKWNTVLEPRKKFSHKGTFGRSVLIAGSKGKMGASILAGRSAFRMGAGLLYVLSPKIGMAALQTALPEAMVVESGKNCLQQIPIPENTDAIALGPGLGVDSRTSKAFLSFLKQHKTPLILDADALNILSENKNYFKYIPKNSLLTPHPKEFERMVESWKNDQEKLQKLQNFCANFHVNMVLKGAYSAVCNPEGKVFFNTTGNPGMATAGSGDVLTGMLLGLLSQNIKPFDALLLGVYLHGLSGDIAKIKYTETSLMASDIIHCIPKALTLFHKNGNRNFIKENIDNIY